MTPITKPPNIIIILADDMGFSDIGCFGSEIKTPHLNAMAEEGIRFSQMYNCARCCPTRASILTGLYPHQAGVGHMIADLGVGKAYQGYLSDDCVTIAEALKPAGYSTFYCGKWHTAPGLPVKGSPAVAPGKEKNPYPLSRGFDRFYGTLAGCGNYFNPHGLMEQDKQISHGSPDFYYTDAISDKACSMIEEAARKQVSFLLHVCYTAPHWPLHAKPEDIEKYRGKYRKGWDFIRTSRHESLKANGILNSKWKISPRDSNSYDFFTRSKQYQEWEDMRMAVYAAQIECMDRGIGKIINTLKMNGIENNTFVMFLSDNGGCAEFLNEDGDDKKWPGIYRFTARPVQICRVGNIEGLHPGPSTTFMSYGLSWANASNSPFRLYKHWVHEGGIATPFIIQWPEKIKHKGSVIHRPCHVIDIMATCLDIANAKYPSVYNGNNIIPLEGESFLPLLNGNEKEREKPLFWEHEGNCAVRNKIWKLVKKYPSDWELYNMEEDRTELNDLSSGNETIKRKLIGQYEEWAEKCGALEWPILKKT